MTTWGAHAQEADTTAQPPVAAQTYKSDIAITNLWAINSMPAPGGLVDFTVYFDNLGTQENVTNVRLTVDYDERNMNSLSLGEPATCVDDGSQVECTYNTLTPGNAMTMGFTAKVAPTATPDTTIVFQANIAGDATENNILNDHESLQVTVTALDKGGKLSAGSGLNAETLEQASTKSSVQVFDVRDNPNWAIDPLSTAGLKFMIRGKEALAWTLSINDAGFHNNAIRDSYLKVLSVVNSLFILGLLAIAAMWMFSLFVPRRILRQAILLFGLAVILVNFALPLNQILVDGAGLLQRTFVGSTHIADLTETPNYSDPTAIGYRNLAGEVQVKSSRKFSVGSVATTDQPAPNDITVGWLDQGGINSPVLTGSIGPNPDSKTSEAITLHSASPLGTSLKFKNGQTLSLTDEKSVDTNDEQRLFAFAMMALTGLAYFGISTAFLLRIVILWALMILSPVLFLLAIFRSTRGTFMSWMSTYARWLLIGPLMALGIAIVVGVWKAVGMPVTSAYPGLGQFGLSTNIGFFLPGQAMANNLSTTPQMMQYLLYLAMLYLPLFLAFTLTRRSVWIAAAEAVSEPHETRGGGATHTRSETATPQPTNTMERAKALTAGITGFLTSGLARRTETAIPAGVRAAEGRPTILPGSALPAQLALTPIREMMTFAVGGGQTRNVHGKAVEKLAAAPSMPDSPEKQSLLSIREELQTRAKDNDVEAGRIVSEIRDREAAIATPPAPTAPTGPVEVQATVGLKTEPKTEPADKQPKPMGLSETEKTEIESIDEEDEKPIPDPLQDEPTHPNE